MPALRYTAEDLALALVVVVEATGDVNLREAAALLGARDNVYCWRWGAVMPLLPGAVRSAVESWRAAGRRRPQPRKKVSDQDLAAGLSLVIEADGWANLRAVARLAGIATRAIRLRLRALLPLLDGADRLAVLARLGGDDLDFEGPAPEADAPTTAAAGSEERIKVYQARAAALVGLHHPEDSPRKVRCSDRGLGSEVARAEEAQTPPRARRLGFRLGGEGEGAAPSFKEGGGSS